MKILNAFSLNMLGSLNATVEFREIGEGEVVEKLTDPDLGGVESAVGHADTAGLFSNILGLEVPCQRETVSLSKGDWAIVGQYRGPRLPEGSTTLPEGASIHWVLVDVN